MKLNYKPLDMQEWVRTQQKAFDRFRAEVMPDRPTFKSVAKRSPEQAEITIMEWILIFLVFVISLFIASKAGINAIPYVEGLIEKLTAGIGVWEEVAVAMIALGIFLYAILQPISVVYAKVMHKEVEGERNATKIRGLYLTRPSTWGKSVNFFALEWLSPRLYFFIVWGGIAWMAFISWYGWDYFFLWIIPLAVEIVGANTLATVIKASRDYRQAIKIRLIPLQDAWDEKLENYESSPEYMRILFAELRNALRNKASDSNNRFAGSEYPNREIFDDVGKLELVKAIVLNEYERWNQGSEFAQTVLSQEEEQEQVEVLDEPDFPTDDDGLYIPLNESGDWTTKSLYKHLLRRGYTLRDGQYYDDSGEQYKESTMNSEYASGYSARTAFRQRKNI